MTSTRSTSEVTPTPLSEYLNAIDTQGYMDAPRHLWGFGGLHGGLILATLAKRAQQVAPATRMRSISGRFYQPVQQGFSVTVATLRGRGRVTSFGATAVAGDTILAEATSIFGADQPGQFPEQEILMPDVASWKESALFEVPPEFVPITEQVEIRLVGATSPYGGHSDPALAAWLRISSDDLPPDESRLLVLLDVLAPSYSAVLDELVPIPTLELSVHFTGRAATESPWVLLSARTDSAPGDGWLSEHFDVWSESGQHLATARQLRIVRPLR